MKEERKINRAAFSLGLGYVVIAALTAVLIVATQSTYVRAIDAQDISDNRIVAPDLPTDDQEPATDTVPYWCGVNNGVKFNTGAVGSHTQGPIEIVISAGPPTAVTSVDTNSDSVIPYKIVVNGGGSDSEDYVWPATVKNMTAPVDNDDDTPPNVAYVIVCYLEKRNSDDQNDQEPDTTNDGGTTDDSQGDVLGVSTQSDGAVLGSTETLAETGASATVAVGTGVAMIVIGFVLSRISGSSASYKA